MTVAAFQVLIEATGVAETSRAMDSMDQKVKSSGAATQAAGVKLTGMAAAAALGFKNAIWVTADFDAQLSSRESSAAQDDISRWIPPPAPLAGNYVLRLRSGRH